MLNSILEQTFHDYEIIITDDSPDDGVQDLVKNYSNYRNIRYYKNHPSLGTPENWNASIRYATGKWIKLMHNDDWFSSKDALMRFVRATEQYPAKDFFFAAFQNITEITGGRQIVKCNLYDLLFLRLSPLHLFRRVYVGNPSCTLIRNGLNMYYDNRFKFVVDFEYYIRCFRHLSGYKYIDEVLLNIGFHDEQVTKYTFLVPEVQLPENITLLKKLGHKILRNPVVYDYYWRMFRNLGIRSEQQVKTYYEGHIPFLLQRMIIAQTRVPQKLLKIGFISKPYMFLNYLLSLLVRH